MKRKLVTTVFLCSLPLTVSAGWSEPVYFWPMVPDPPPYPAETDPCLTYDNETMYFVKFNISSHSPDIYTVEWDGYWKNLNLVISPISTSAWEFDPCISSDGNTLYFSSNRSGGEGYQDIWKSEKDDYGDWQTPENLGSVINHSDADDVCPHISNDGNTLYYCIGHKMYVSEWDEEAGEWGEPTKLPDNVNGGPNVRNNGPSIDDTTLYFSSNRGAYWPTYKIWKSENQGGGSWSNPVYVGDLDSGSDCYSPSVSRDDSKMVVASSTSGWRIVMVRISSAE